MNLMDFKTNKESTFSELKCELTVNSPFTSVEGVIHAKGIDTFELHTKDGFYSFRFKRESDARMILDHMRQNNYNLAYVRPTGNQSAEFDLHVVFFYTAKIDKKTNIIISEKVKETLRKKKLVSLKPEEFEETVRRNFILNNGTSICYAYTSGFYKYDDLLETKDEKEVIKQDSDEIESNQETTSNFDTSDEPTKEVAGRKLKIYGSEYSLSVSQKAMGEDVFLYADKVDIVNANIPNLALNIGDITFQDGDRYVSEKIRKELSDTVGYIDLWDQYTKLEGDYLLERSRSVGVFSINRNNCSITEGGLSIMPIGLSKDALMLLTNGDRLLFTENAPIYIQDSNMTWTQFKDYFMALEPTNTSRKAGVAKKIKRIDKSGYIVIETGDDEEVPEGLVSLDIYGDMQQILRREDARDLIMNAESANPALGRIIEGRTSGQFMDMREAKKISPLSPFVKEKIFEYEPTPTQVKAIDIALNTPDIAIIQGPPGTGKTTVITAIIERLNEMADKRNDVKGHVLVTSFQHDAVRNVIERLSINSLPTIKFGTQGDEDVSMEKTLEKWCDDYKSRLIKRNPTVNSTIEQKRLVKLRDMYMMVPNDSNAISFLKYARTICLDNELIEEIDFLLDDISGFGENETSDLMKKILRLRVTKQGFIDDGPDNADDLLDSLEKIINREVDENRYILRVLEEAADTRSDEISDQLLKSLEAIRNLLIEKCTPKPSYRVDRAREDVLGIYDQVLNKMHNPKNEEEEILFNLLNELDGNLSGVLDSVVGYNFVFSATTQQSEGYAIKMAKDVVGEDHPTYDTIIIDEAARVNPGDLMIPMSQGKRRIILVGDHRQLPHIYNEEIFENMHVSEGTVDKDVIKKSMFEYLMDKAKELYAQDGVERTITLDAQYRMHPLLGEFVSKQFYEDNEEGFKSPLPAKMFEQSFYDKPLVWINVKNSIGPEEKYGTSRVRICEADLIAKKVKEFIESGKGIDSDGKELTYGVITFYSAQVKEIKKKLGVYADKVRVGSVDAFQGMEFDVIFLSVVRSHKSAPDANVDLLSMDEPGEKSEIYEEWNKYISNLGMKNYGFLTSVNRLCVALSRQKKLLIVVGDSNIFVGKDWENISERCVPAMKRLYELAKMEGVVING